MQILISKSNAPDNRMSGDMSDSRVVRLTKDFIPWERVPRITRRSDDSLVVELDGVHQETRGKILATLKLKIWGDVTISEIA